MESIKKICENPELGFCPVETGIELLSGKWKTRIMWKLYRAPALSFGELREELDPITEKILTQQLRELESVGLITRQPRLLASRRVEYSPSEFGETLRPVFEKFAQWGFENKEKILAITNQKSLAKRITLASSIG